MVKTSEMSMELKQELAFTKEELAELEAAKKMPITFDADCPETTPERAVKFRRVNPPRNRMDAHADDIASLCREHQATGKSIYTIKSSLLGTR